MNPILLYLAWKTTRRAKPHVRTGERRLSGLLRVGSYALLCSLGLAGVVAHKAQADVGSAALSMGRELAETTRSLEGGYTARLNGQAFHLGEQVSERSVGEILDRAEQACTEAPGALTELFESMPKSGKLAGGKPYKLEGSFAHGVVRNGTDKDGVVMCFLGDPEHPRSTADALAAFAKSQDLGDLGKLRYVYAKRDPQGKTRVTTAWTDEHFSLRAISEGGETSGHDGVVPRPEGARRLLTAELDGAPQSTNVFTTDAGVGQVVAHYDETLEKAGFRRLTPTAEGQTLRVYFRDGFEVLVAAHTEEQKTVFAVTEQKAQSKNVKNVLEVSP